MKKFLAVFGASALVVGSTLGASFPATANVQTVAETVEASDAVVASPDAVLTVAEPVVAVVQSEPATVVPETVQNVQPVGEPVVIASEPVAVSEPVVQYVAVSEPVETVAEPVAELVVAAEPETVQNVTPVSVPVQIHVCEQNWWIFEGYCINPESANDGGDLEAYAPDGTRVTSVDRFTVGTPDVSTVDLQIYPVESTEPVVITE